MQIIRYMGGVRLLSLTGHVYLNGVWLGVHLGIYTTKIHVWKGLDYVFKFY